VVVSRSLIVMTEEGKVICTCAPIFGELSIGLEEAKENAQFIADAFNAVNKRAQTSKAKPKRKK